MLIINFAIVILIPLCAGLAVSWYLHNASIAYSAIYA